MRRRTWYAIAGAIAGAGCLSIPPPPGTIDSPAGDGGGSPDAFVCLPTDGDCDGWLPDAPNPDARDCDDGNPLINPGAIDDIGNGVDEDCIGGPETIDPLPGASYESNLLSTEPFVVQFNTQSRMPSLLVMSSVDVLHHDAGCAVSNEEGIGVSLYPAVAVHVRSSPIVGSVTGERIGPAMATALIQWLVPIASTGTPMCDADTDLTANIRLTALPGGRIVRDDRINVSTGVSACAGCAAGQTAPIFTSYVSLTQTFDQYEDNRGVPMTFPSNMSLAPADDYKLCVGQAAGTRKIGFNWYFPDPGTAGLRLKSTSIASASLVYDWRRSTPVESGNYEAVTTMIGEDQAGTCSGTLWGGLDDVALPAASNELAFDHGLGIYQPISAPTGNAVTFSLLGAMMHGLAVRVTGLGPHGVTVWIDGVRQRAGPQYLVQHDPDGAYVVWIPSLQTGQVVIIAGPGGEP